MDENKFNNLENEEAKDIPTDAAEEVKAEATEQLVNEPEEAAKTDYSLYNIRPNAENQVQLMPQPQSQYSGQYYQPPYQRQYYSADQPPYQQAPQQPTMQNDGQGLHAAQPEQPKKKGRVWKIIAIVVAAVMFSCALLAAVIVPIVQELGYMPNTETQDPQTGEQEENDVIKEFEDFFNGWMDEGNQWNDTLPEEEVEYDYSDVEYPDTLPAFDGKSIVITDKYNPVPEIASQVSACVVEVFASTDNADGTVSGSLGTGVIISSEGYILTNAHVISGGQNITVTLNSGDECEGTLMGVDSNMDIAVIKIDKNGLKAVKIADSSKVIVGERAIAIGNPAGAGAYLTGTVTVGYVSAVERELLFNDTYQRFIQTDVALNPGNSGGPLLNDKGELIGIVTLKSLVSSVAEDGTIIDTEGIGFAIPINSAMETAGKIILSGDIERPGLGVMVQEITEEMAKENDLHAGVLIQSFIEGSLAESAGLQVNDIICGFDGREIKTMDELSAELGNKYVGDKITLKVWRAGEYLEFDIVLSDLNTLD